MGPPPVWLTKTWNETASKTTTQMLCLRLRQLQRHLYAQGTCSSVIVNGSISTLSNDSRWSLGSTPPSSHLNACCMDDENPSAMSKGTSEGAVTAV